MGQVLDMTVVDELLSLSDDGDPELLLDLIRLFLEDGPSKIQFLTEGVARRDFAMVERASHTLKGSSGNLGARGLQETCERLQATSREHDLTAIQQLSVEAQAQFAEVCNALKALQRRFTQAV